MGKTNYKGLTCVFGMGLTSKREEKHYIYANHVPNVSPHAIDAHAKR